MPDILNMIREPARETRPVDLGDYAEDYRGIVIYVWVTPTRAHVQRWGQIADFIQGVNQKKDELSEDEKLAALEEWNEQVLAWYADTWVRLSVGDESQDVTLAVAREIHDLLGENLPAAWDWLCQRTHSLIVDYRNARLKN